jgi:myosin heavy subunit
MFPEDCNLIIWQGVLEAVRISLAGYPTRRTYAEFVDRFGVLVPELMLGRYAIYTSLN